MAAAAPFLRVSRHFVTPEPRTGKFTQHQVSHFSERIRIRNSFRHPSGKGCSLLNRELIKREMRAAGSDCFPQILGKRLPGLPRKAEHNVDIEIIKGCCGLTDCCSRIVRGMNAAENPELPVIKTLNSK